MRIDKCITGLTFLTLYSPVFSPAFNIFLAKDRSSLGCVSTAGRTSWWMKKFLPHYRAKRVRLLHAKVVRLRVNKIAVGILAPETATSSYQLRRGATIEHWLGSSQRCSTETAIIPHCSRSSPPTRTACSLGKSFSKCPRRYVAAITTMASVSVWAQFCGCCFCC